MIWLGITVAFLVQFLDGFQNVLFKSYQKDVERDGEENVPKIKWRIAFGNRVTESPI